MSKEKIQHGLRSLKGYDNPSQQLRDDILKKLREGQEPWVRGNVVSASGIADEAELAPGTVRAVLQRFVSEGVFRVDPGTGYTVLSKEPAALATTLVSVSAFCAQAGLECISVLDPESCIKRPCADLAPEVSDDPGEQARFRARTPDLLDLRPQDDVLFVRRIRGWRKQQSRAPLQWGILETVFLVPSLVRGLEERLRAEMRPLGEKQPIGNVPLHGWFASNHVELSRSEYLLSVGRLARNDQAAWRKVEPTPQHPADGVFIRLRAVTFMRDKTPLLYTIENVVPGALDFKVSGFQFGDPELNTFP